ADLNRKRRILEAKALTELDRHEHALEGTFIMVDRPDTGMHRIKILGPDTIEVVGIESGPNAVVARSIFKRK
ncbi:MAG: hypothetical protein AAGB11_19915, partial [Pseudomonadota bacterium]